MNLVVWAGLWGSISPCYDSKQFFTGVVLPGETALRAGAGKSSLPPSTCTAPHLNINTSSLVLYSQVQQANKGLFKWQIFLGFISWLPSGGSLTKALNLPLFCLFPAAEACRGNAGRQEGKALQKNKTFSGPRSASIREEIKISENTIGGSLSFWVK